MMDVDSASSPEVLRCLPSPRPQESPERKCHVCATFPRWRAIGVANKSTRFLARRYEEQSVAKRSPSQWNFYRPDQFAFFVPVKIAFLQRRGAARQRLIR